MTFKQKLEELSVCKTWEMDKDKFYYDISKEDLDKLVKKSFMTKRKFEKLNYILIGVLFSGYMQGSDRDFLNKSVVDKAMIDIDKLLN